MSLPVTPNPGIQQFYVKNNARTRAIFIKQVFFTKELNCLGAWAGGYIAPQKVGAVAYCNEHQKMYHDGTSYVTAHEEWGAGIEILWEPAKDSYKGPFMDINVGF